MSHVCRNKRILCAVWRESGVFVGPCTRTLLFLPFSFFSFSFLFLFVGWLSNPRRAHSVSGNTEKFTAFSGYNILVFRWFSVRFTINDQIVCCTYKCNADNVWLHFEAELNKFAISEYKWGLGIIAKNCNCKTHLRERRGDWWRVLNRHTYYILTFADHANVLVAFYVFFFFVVLNGFIRVISDIKLHMSLALTGQSQIIMVFDGAVNTVSAIKRFTFFSFYYTNIIKYPYTHQTYIYYIYVFFCWYVRPTIAITVIAIAQPARPIEWLAEWGPPRM